MDVVGISAFYHDAAAAVIRDGKVIAAAQEERFSRQKHDPAFPKQALRWCLESAGVEPNGIDLVAYYEKPLSSFVRVMRSFGAAGLRGLRAAPAAFNEWGTNKLWTGFQIERQLLEMGWKVPGDIYYADHHQSHAASAFYPSPFKSAAVLTFDGVGEWATSSIAHGNGTDLRMLRELRYPHSLGLLYSAFTYHCGFRVNSGEYKLMGLAPFGEPRYVDRIMENLVDLRDDGSFTLDQRYFSYLAGKRMTNKRFDQLFDGPARNPEGPLTQRDADLARSIQEVVENIVMAIAVQARTVTNERKAVLAGGVALNCVSNARLLREGPFDDLWIQPASGDAGGAIGCALAAWHQEGGERPHLGSGDGMNRALLGPHLVTSELEKWVSDGESVSAVVSEPKKMAEQVATHLADGAVVGVFDGRAEFGPRALGNRSILADPRRKDMQRTLNLKIKKRESFRPFAPAVLAEHVGDWFDLNVSSPYMLLVSQVLGFELPTSNSKGEASSSVGAAKHDGADPARLVETARLLDSITSPIPAVTHVDGSARVQTVDEDSSSMLRGVLTAFFEKTGCPVLVNTSFNVRGEPIVNSPEDAYRCFMTTDMDVLVIEDRLFLKADQPKWAESQAVSALD